MPTMHIFVNDFTLHLALSVLSLYCNDKYTFNVICRLNFVCESIANDAK